MLALGLTPKANEQGYEPEWLTSRPGLRRPGHRVAAHRRRGSGRTPSASPTTPSPSRRAARSPTPPTSRCGRTTSRPSASRRSTTRCTCWRSASRWPGPNLTPQYLRGRDVRLPGRQRAPRAAGTSAPGDYTPTDDFREIWWDPNRISPQNNQPGAWVQLNGGAPLHPGQRPQGARPPSSRRADRGTTTDRATTAARARPARARGPRTSHLFRRLRPAGGRRRSSSC